MGIIEEAEGIGWYEYCISVEKNEDAKNEYDISSFGLRFLLFLSVFHDNFFNKNIKLREAYKLCLLDVYYV